MAPEDALEVNPGDAGRRRLGAPSLTAVVIANMIGAGVFTTSGFALGDLGSPGRVMAAWAVGGVIALLGAISYGALASRLPESGGEYLFISRTVHPAAGFLAGWVSMWAGFTSAIALAAEAAQSYVAAWLPAALPPDVVGATAIVAMGVLHTRGVERGARVQTAVVGLKLLGLVAIVGVGLALLPSAAPAPTPPSPADGTDLGAFAVTLMWVSLSYSGWNAAVYIAGEARQPERSVPRAMIAGTLITTALYLGLNWVFVYAAPIGELAFKPDVAAIAARTLGGPWLEAAMRGAIAAALLTSISSMVMIGPRVYARMADEGLLPRPLHFTGAVPRQAIWLQVALSLVVLFTSGLRTQLTNLGWVLSLFTALSVVGLLRLRAREGAEAVPIPGHPLVPLAFLVSVLTFAGLALRSSGAALTPALVLLGSGVLVHAAVRRPRGSEALR